MYQIVLHASNTCKHMVFAAPTREGAERQAALWCLSEVLQEWDLQDVRSAPGTRDFARELGKLALDGRYGEVMVAFVEDCPDRYQVVSHGEDAVEVVSCDAHLQDLLHRACQRTPEEVIRVLAQLGPLTTPSS